MQRPEVIYKGFALVPVITSDDGMYATLLTIREPDGTQRATDVLGEFPCPLEARRFALQYGMAEIDHRKVPEPEWTRTEWQRRRQTTSAAAHAV
jgi:hypothetical protein